jgi:hypothetical protein
MFRILAVSVCVSVSAVMCRFTVRDVGFVDLGDPGYRYYTFVSDAQSLGATESSRKLAEAIFADTNIEFTVVDPLDDLDQTGREYLRDLKIKRFPTTVLVHPDGRAIEMPIEGSFDASAASVFESVASSRLRTRITEAVLRRYCVVLLAECDDAKKNEDATRAVATAFAAIKKVFDKMPKDVGTLPELIAIPRTDQADEKILLWSLGVKAVSAKESREHPAVTVLTGRVRRFGTTLEGEDINEDSVLGILAKAGESCECGLDRSWMRGMRVPLRWDADTRQLASDVLGFDPENPLVKAEISSILAKGPNGQPGTDGGPPTVADLLLGYSEAAIAEGDPIEEEKPTLDTEKEEETEPASGRAMLWTLGGLLFASLGVAAFVLLRVRR